ncbi:hypothetical protein F4815DRAFT_459801 [Daldinia loculata]|uniref:uncharacterized protein n=1 Tax=Daldinia loculata TaxID=103429 RepID=UPI0020C2B009|nr:uncharacterized protein F4817DRAFT_330647 [Daldinia loculata]KAI1649531.1 hypothetical protein F4817DRAFT_330647 [Daldinia loculata]KAI2783086.1 hypothetical protein F4815DRAFT_459801 [Daldinia loculata]
MYTNNAIVLAALAACASAQIPNLMPRQTFGSSDPEETESSPECISRVQSWSSAFPTPAPALESAMDSATVDGGMAESGLSGLCQYGTALGKDQGSAYTSYCLDMYSYLSSQSSNLLALATTCSGDMGAPPEVITSQLDELLSVYSQFSAGGCKAVSATTTADSSSETAASSDSSSAATTSASGSATTTGSSEFSAAAAASSSAASAIPSGNASPRETGMFAAAALAAGFIGAAVAL